MKIAIIGYGHVGKALHTIFPNAKIYDPAYEEHNDINLVQDIDAAFICVPSPQSKSGKCDTNIVEKAIMSISANIYIIRSTVYVGFTKYITNKTGKNVVFQPEYYGETINHPFADTRIIDWLSFGGTNEAIDMAIEVYKQVKASNIRIIRGDAKSIEMAKYMENAFLAMKVTFANEMFDIANGLGANYNIAREAWIADPRIGASHTFVYENNRGYSGKCLPKDVSNIIYQAKEANVNADFVIAMENKNEKQRSK